MLNHYTMLLFCLWRMNRTSVSMCLLTRRPAPLDDPQVLTVFGMSLTNRQVLGTGLKPASLWLKIMVPNSIRRPQHFIFQSTLQKPCQTKNWSLPFASGHCRPTLVPRVHCSTNISLQTFRDLFITVLIYQISCQTHIRNKKTSDFVFDWETCQRLGICCG